MVVLPEVHETLFLSIKVSETRFLPPSSAHPSILQAGQQQTRKGKPQNNTTQRQRQNSPKLQDNAFNTVKTWPLGCGAWHRRRLDVLPRVLEVVLAVIRVLVLELMRILRKRESS